MQFMEDRVSFDSQFEGHSLAWKRGAGGAWWQGRLGGGGLEVAADTVLPQEAETCECPFSSCSLLLIQPTERCHSHVVDLLVSINPI